MLFFQILTLHLWMKQRALRRRIFLCAFSKRLKHDYLLTLLPQPRRHLLINEFIFFSHIGGEETGVPGGSGIWCFGAAPSPPLSSRPLPSRPCPSALVPRPAVSPARPCPPPRSQTSRCFPNFFPLALPCGSHTLLAPGLFSSPPKKSSWGSGGNVSGK